RAAIVPGIILLLLGATPPSEEPAPGRRGPGALFAVANLRFERLGAAEEAPAEPSPSEEPREEPGSEDASSPAESSCDEGSVVSSSLPQAIHLPRSPVSPDDTDAFDPPNVNCDRDNTVRHRP